MRKLLTCLMALYVCLVAAVASAAPTTPAESRPFGGMQDLLSTSGTIQEIGENRVTVKGVGTYEEIILHISPKSYIVRSLDGEKLPFSELKGGDQVVAYYGPSVTRSLPPQGQAVALVVGPRDNGAIFMRVAEVEQTTNGVRALCTNRDRLVSIRSDIFAQTDRIQSGSDLLVWYQMMTLSLPGQATATKAMLLNPKADILVHPSAGVIVARGKELQLGENARIERKEDGMVYVPLRVIVEQLGYEVRWNSETQEIELQNGARTATLAVGSLDYGKQKMRVQLTHAPENNNGTTLVPTEFFSEVLGYSIEILNGNV